MLSLRSVLSTVFSILALAAPAAASSGIANPAATHCVEAGGEYVIHKSDAGQTGFCRMSDGVERDAWQMFRESHAQEASIPNPAAAYCVEVGGSYDTESGNCRLADGRIVNGWDLFRAAHAGKE